MPDEALSDPERQRLEAEKLVRENEKLRLEISYLARPWWRNPSFLGVLVPSILALGTLATGYFSGYFEVQTKLIEINKVKLEADKKELERGNEGLKQERVKMTTELTGARQRNQEELDALRRSTADERKRLETELASLSEKIALAPVIAHVDALKRSGTDISPLHNSSRELIRLIQQDQPQDTRNKYTRIVTEGLEAKPPNSVLRANLLYVLYKTTGAERWRTELFTLTRSEGPRLDWRFWSVFRDGDWKRDGGSVYDLLGELVETPGIPEWVAGSALSSLSPIELTDEVMKQIKNPKGVLGTLRVARNMALNRKATWLDRVSGLGALASMAPGAFLVTTGQLLTSPDPDVDVVSGLRRYLDRVGPRVQSLGPPATVDPASWKAWSEKNRELVNVWTEPNLETVRQRPELIGWR